jgi:hypothetical protein
MLDFRGHVAQHEAFHLHLATRVVDVDTDQTPGSVIVQHHAAGDFTTVEWGYLV